MYDKNWDKYYHHTYKVMKKKALWDVSPKEAVENDFDIFSAYMNDDLIMVDLGCGTGGQANYLSEKYKNVIAVDVSKEAISVAQSENNNERIVFDVLDVTKKVGDHHCFSIEEDHNIYMRGVLHQIKDEDIAVFQNNILDLLGAKGNMYCVEVADSIKEVLTNTQGDFNQLPKRMQQVFISNLPPRGLSLENIYKYFPENKFKILLSGKTDLNTNIKYSNNTSIKIPAIFVLLQSA